MRELPQMRMRIRDGEEVVQFRCPLCGTWGDLDEPDNLAPSIICSECGWHGFHDGRSA